MSRPVHRRTSLRFHSLTSDANKTIPPYPTAYVLFYVLRLLIDSDISCRFHPGYLTAERLAKAKKLKLAITAGIGSDHVDLDAANKTNGGVTVAEVTGSNVVSVAEHVVMTILTLVRNFVPAHEQIQAGEWNVAAVAKNEYDLEGKVVGTVAVGRIGERVLRRLKPFDCKELLYFDYQPLKPEIEKEIGCRKVDTLEEMLGQCDVVTINCPLHEKTRGLFNKELISKMKKGMSTFPEITIVSICYDSLYFVIA